MKVTEWEAGLVNNAIRLCMITAYVISKRKPKNLRQSKSRIIFIGFSARSKSN